MTVRTWFDHAEKGVVDAMEHACFIHGVPTTDPVRGTATLSEEVGEVAECALDATRGKIDTNRKILCLTNMVAELNQVAAYAILLRCQMEGEIQKLRGAQTDEPA